RLPGLRVDQQRLAVPPEPHRRRHRGAIGRDGHEPRDDLVAQASRNPCALLGGRIDHHRCSSFIHVGLHAIMHPMFYLQRGEVPHKRHTQFRKPDGGLFAEELFGIEGFSGRASLLYHHTPPTQTHAVEKVRDVALEQSVDEASGAHRHRLVNTKDLEPAGDGITGRVPLFYNGDVVFGVVLPSEPMERYYRNGEADEMYFVHTGTGTLE